VRALFGGGEVDVAAPIHVGSRDGGGVVEDRELKVSEELARTPPIDDRDVVGALVRGGDVEVGVPVQGGNSHRVRVEGPHGQADGRRERAISTVVEAADVVVALVGGDDVEVP